MSDTSRKLMEMYEAMRSRFGHQGWWPGDGKLETCVGAILTQNTNWRNVSKAIANLRSADCMSIARLHALSRDELAELIKPAGYFNVKAKRLKNFVSTVVEDFGGDIDALLGQSADALRYGLLAVNGIGPETADSIILYAAGRLSFVVDTYTYRILLRHGLLGPEDDYDSTKELFESNLPDDVDLWNDYHAQLVAVGKQYCRPRAKCRGCPLEPFDHDELAGIDQYD